MAANEWTWHSDPGHAWLHVKHEDVVNLGVEDDISRYSYRDGDDVYLEEDRDAGVFIKEYCSQVGKQWSDIAGDVGVKYHNDDAPCRSFEPYWV